MMSSAFRGEVPGSSESCSSNGSDLRRHFQWTAYCALEHDTQSELGELCQHHQDLKKRSASLFLSTVNRFINRFQQSTLPFLLLSVFVMVLEDSVDGVASDESEERAEEYIPELCAQTTGNLYSYDNRHFPLYLNKLVHPLLTPISIPFIVENTDSPPTMQAICRSMTTLNGRVAIFTAISVRVNLRVNRSEEPKVSSSIMSTFSGLTARSWTKRVNYYQWSILTSHTYPSTVPPITWTQIAESRPSKRVETCLVAASCFTETASKLVPNA